MNRNILLISASHDVRVRGKPLHLQRVRYRPPTNLLSVGSVLEKEGFNVDVIDTAVDENYEMSIRSKLLNDRYMLILINAVMETRRPMMLVREVHDICKRCQSDVPVVWDEYLSSARPEVALRKYGADYVVRFNREDTIVHLAKAIADSSDLGGVYNISYMHGDEVRHNDLKLDGDSLDFVGIPAWHLLGDKMNREQYPYYACIISSYGCKNNCSFCYLRSYDSVCGAHKWRPRSMSRVLQELEYLRGKYNIDVFSIEDDNFLVDKPRAISIFDEIKKRGLYLERVRVSMNCLDADIVRAMSGLVNEITYSLETASGRLAGYLDKHIDLRKIEEMNRLLYECGINSFVGIMHGLPTENDDDRRVTIEFMKKLKDVNPYMRASLSFFRPLPNTPIVSYIKEHYGCGDFIDDTYLEQYDWYIDSDMDENIKQYYLDVGEANYLKDYCRIFNIVFSPNNMSMKSAVKSFFKSNKRLANVFGDIETYYWMSGEYKPYLLDKLLAGSKFNLKSDLKYFGDLAKDKHIPSR